MLRLKSGIRVHGFRVEGTLHLGSCGVHVGLILKGPLGLSTDYEESDGDGGHGDHEVYIAAGITCSSSQRILSTHIKKI